MRPLLLIALRRPFCACTIAIQKPSGRRSWRRFWRTTYSLLEWFRHLRVDISLLSAFKGLDDEARRTLQEFSAPLDLDVTTWPSNRLQYFKDAYPVFAFLAVWMDEEGLHDLVDQFGDILRAGVYAVAGYGILDENVDSACTLAG